MAICDLDLAPAFERSKHHEEIGGAIALVLIIETGRASRFHRDPHARFGNELLRGLVEANQRTIAVAWPRIDVPNPFALRRSNPHDAHSHIRSRLRAGDRVSREDQRARQIHFPIARIEGAPAASSHSVGYGTYLWLHAIRAWINS